MTGHVVDGRPDTGASGWIKRGLIDGGVTKGRKIGIYKIDMDCVPDAIITKEEKHAKYIQWVEEPKRLHNDKAIRSGLARYYGDWEEGGGLILSAFNASIHMIEPFDIFKHKPLIYRMIDHGENPCAAALIALFPWGDAVFYKEYYAFARSIKANAKGITEELCGNEVKQISSGGEYEGVTWGMFEEIEKKTHLVASEMDSRSYGRQLKESGRLIGQAYIQGGCRCAPADGRSNHTKDNEGCIDLLCQWFELDDGREHINKKLGRPVPDLCMNPKRAPRFYIFNNCTSFRREIEGWSRNPNTGKPLDENDHLISCAKFFAARERVYNECLLSAEYEQMAEVSKVIKSDFTGY
jgi:hypothetical protein